MAPMPFSSVPDRTHTAISAPFTACVSSHPGTAACYDEICATAGLAFQLVLSLALQARLAVHLCLLLRKA